MDQRKHRKSEGKVKIRCARGLVFFSNHVYFSRTVDRSQPIPVETSMKYLDSKAYQEVVTTYEFQVIFHYPWFFFLDLWRQLGLGALPAKSQGHVPAKAHSKDLHSRWLPLDWTSVSHLSRRVPSPRLQKYQAAETVHFARNWRDPEL